MNPISYIGPKLSCVLLFLGITFSSNRLFAQLFVEWNKTYGGAGWEEFQTVNKTDDGGYIFGGITTTEDPSCDVTEHTRDTVVFPQLTGDVWLVKTDGEGNIEWDKRYGGWDQDRMWSVSQTPDGGFIIGGESLSGEDAGTEHTEYNRGGLDFWLVKIDDNGNHLWNRTYGGSENDVLRTVIPLDDGGYMLLGYSYSPSFLVAPGDKSEDSRGLSDFWIVRLNELGNVVWDRTIGGDGDDWLTDAHMLLDGNIIACGWSTSGISGEKTDPNYGLNDYWIVKLDINNADVIWQRTIGGDSEDVPQSMYISNDGGIILLGNSRSGANGTKTVPNYGSHDGWIVKLRDLGNDSSVEWQQGYGGQSDDFAYSAAETSLGNLMVVGVTASQADTINTTKLSPLVGSQDFWINYLNPDGTYQWDMSIGGTGADVCTKIIPAHEYGFIFGGHSSSGVYEPFKSDNNCNEVNFMNDIYIVRTGCNIEPPNLESDTITCTNEFITLNATVDSCLFCEYIWEDGPTTPIRIVSPDSAMDLRVTVVHPDGCEVSAEVNLEITSGIDTVLTAFTPLECFGDTDAEFIIEEIRGGAGPYLFKFNDGEWDSLGFYTDLEPGTYTLEVVDTNGCNYNTSFYIEQPQEVLLELGDDIYLNYGDSVQVQALTNLLFDFSVVWNSSTELSCEDCLEPWTSSLTSSTNISVTVADSNGCSKNDELSIIVENFTNVYIPNAFSPNNDNVNDYFTIYADNSVRKINHFKVFDRKGELLFERDDFSPNIDQLGYDGRFDGKFMQPQVLAYWVEVEYMDGSTELFKGDVQLMR